MDRAGAESAKPTPISVASLGAAQALIGRELGPTSWHSIDQAKVNAFAEATGDHQWIHVDVAKATSGPFGRPIAHGFLTLSMLPAFLPQLLDLSAWRLVVNAGCDRVRFPAPVPVGRRIRASVTVQGVADVKGSVQLLLAMVVSAEESDKPSCVAAIVLRLFT